MNGFDRLQDFISQKLPHIYCTFQDKELDVAKSVHNPDYIYQTLYDQTKEEFLQERRDHVVSQMKEEAAQFETLNNNLSFYKEQANLYLDSEHAAMYIEDICEGIEEKNIFYSDASIKAELELFKGIHDGKDPQDIEKDLFERFGDEERPFAYALMRYIPDKDDYMNGTKIGTFIDLVYASRSNDR